MSKPKVFVFSPVLRMGETYNSYNMLVDAGCEVVYGKASWLTPQGNNEDEMCEMAKGADALTGGTIRSTPISARIMKITPELRIVAKASIGVEDVDVEAATEMGILVTHAPTESNWSGVAEGTVAILLALLKKIRERDEAVKQGKWREPFLQGIYVGRQQGGYAGLTIGIVGLGRIGRRFADLMAPWRVRILAYDPYVEESRFILCNAERVNLQTLLKESDVVSLHVVLTRETRQMIGAEELALMKKGAVLINTSRGQVVNEKALVEALQNDHLACAGMDVFEDEPLHADSPLLKMGHKVLLSPHMASSNYDNGLRQGILWANRAVLAALKGELPDGIYNKAVIPKWLARFGGRRL